jgi:sugar lactone lactonase YvrE
LPPGARPGRLYRLDTDGSLRVVLEGVMVSNGMGFTPDRRSMYYTDSGLPDGMTVDAQGIVWRRPPPGR